MIWISTLCLLCIALWLFFNALNERRWVQAHSHDESVASDTGLLPSFSARTGSGTYDADGKVSIAQENTRFARAVSKVQEKSQKYGEKLFESKVVAARVGDGEDRPRSAREENTLFGRAVARVGEKVENMDSKLERQMKAASSETTRPGDGRVQDEGLFARATRKVAAKSDEISERVAKRASGQSFSLTNDTESGRKVGDVLDKAVEKVAGKVRNFESRVDQRLADKRSGDGEDIVSRVASRVGKRVNELDEKLIANGRKSGDKNDGS